MECFLLKSKDTERSVVSDWIITLSVTWKGFTQVWKYNKYRRYITGSLAKRSSSCPQLNITFCVPAEDIVSSNCMMVVMCARWQSPGSLAKRSSSCPQLNITFCVPTEDIVSSVSSVQRPGSAAISSSAYRHSLLHYHGGEFFHWSKWHVIAYTNICTTHWATTIRSDNWRF